MVSDPRGALPSPERHAADLAHHACITYRRPVDSRARQPSPAGRRRLRMTTRWLASAPQFFLMRRPQEQSRTRHARTPRACRCRLRFAALLLRKSRGAAAKYDSGASLDDDCMVALLVKAHARSGRPHGGESRRHGRWAQSGAVRAAASPLWLGRARVMCFPRL